MRKYMVEFLSKCQGRGIKIAQLIWYGLLNHLFSLISYAPVARK